MSPGARQEAQREAAVLKSLSHPNVVAHEETCLSEQMLFIVMEYADGGDLASAVERQRQECDGRLFGEQEVMSAFAQCCAGLEHIHGKRVLHRDLKCQNIFMMRDGTVKLGDFGIAKILAHTTSKAKTAVGTPYYASPEVCDNQTYGFKADVWSLGVVLYQLIALEIPFKAASLVALVLKIIQSEPKPLPDSFSEAARDVCLRTLRKDPEERPSASQLLQLPAVCEALARRPPGTLLPTVATTGDGDRPEVCDATDADKPIGDSDLKGPRCSGSLGSNTDAVDALLAALADDKNLQQEAAPSRVATPARSGTQARSTAGVPLLPPPPPRTSNSSTPRTPSSRGSLSAQAAHLVQKEQEIFAAQALALHGLCGLRRDPSSSRALIVEPEPFATPRQYLCRPARQTPPTLNLSVLEAKLGPSVSSPSCPARRGRKQPKCFEDQSLGGHASKRGAAALLAAVESHMEKGIAESIAGEEGDEDFDPTSPMTMAYQLHIPGAQLRSRPGSREQPPKGLASKESGNGRPLVRQPPPLMQVAARRANRVQSMPEFSIPQPPPLSLLHDRAPATPVKAEPALLAGGSSRSRRSHSGRADGGIQRPLPPQRC
eukprot:TRINITY_DN21581_c0_g1_i1.p1 TRINITY_DN21581_c0_g1~~TRINITY_DN21581_c0_g1_i1.p1  ORF type:complete len:690 (+),score=106.88 TRINITY_DN21581_c0_g1_i1:263-2071(+)